MDAQSIDWTLTETEAALARERRPDLKRLGFWRAVAAVKRDPELISRYADRIGAIDRRAFEQGVPVRLPAAVGLLVDLSGVVVGVLLMATVHLTTGEGQFTAFDPAKGSEFWQTLPRREFMFLAGVGAVLATTHTLAHWIVGTLFGIRFTHFFSVPPLRPQPGFKIDYASYLRRPAHQRAWMHASGAIVTKLVPFAALPFAIQTGLQDWAVWLIVIIGVVQIATDALWSVKASDWKKFRREMRAARA